MKREADGCGLALEEFTADTVHSNAVVGFRHRGEKRHDMELLLLEQRVQRHGAVFAAAPAEEDGFESTHEQFSVVSFRFSVKRKD